MRRSQLTRFGIVLASVIVLAGCASTPAPDASGSAPPSAPAPTASKSAAEQEQEIRDLVARAVTTTGSTGALVLVEGSGIHLEFASGAGDIDGGALTTDMHFRVASNTKAMTCTVMLQQVDAGIITLDQEVAEFAPQSEIIANLAAAHDLSGLTFRNLCQHTGGLGEYYAAMEEEFVNEPGLVFEKQTLLESGFARPRTGAIDERFTYSNTGFVLVDVALEAATGKAMAQLYQDGIFTPLELTETSYPAPDDLTIPLPHPRGYATPVDAAGEFQRDASPQDVTGVSPSPGFISTMLHNPETGTTIVVMLNNSDFTGSTAQALGLGIGAIVDGPGIPWTVEEATAQIFDPAHD